MLSYLNETHKDSNGNKECVLPTFVTAGEAGFNAAAAGSDDDDEETKGLALFDL